MAVRRGEVHLARLDPAQGSEQRKTRPVVIVQNDIDNRFSPVTIAAPVTSRQFDESYPTQVRFLAPEGGLERDSAILCNQVRVLDRGMPLARTGAMSAETMERVDEALRAALDLD